MVERELPEEVKILTSDLQEPTLPLGISAEDRRSLEDAARAEVRKFVNAEGSEELTIEDRLALVGRGTQVKLSGENSDLGLLQEKMRRLIEADKKSASGQLSSELEELTSALDRINPDEIKGELFFKLMRLMPFGNKLVRILKEAADRNQTVADFIDKMKEQLRGGQQTLISDNAQLRVLYQRIEERQKAIRKEAFLAELIMRELDTEKQKTDDAQMQAKLQNLLFRVSTRAQDLYAMVETYEQGLASVRIIRESNSLLIGSVDRMLTYGMDAVYIGFAIYVALYHQGNVLNAYQKTREFVGNRIKQNAAAIEEHTRKIGDIYKEPIISMKALEEAHLKIISAMNELDKNKAIAIENARVNIGRLKEMSEDLLRRSKGTEVVEVDSINASNLVATRPTSAPERPKIGG